MALALVGSVITGNGNNDLTLAINGTTSGNGLILGVYWAGGTVEPPLAVSGETVLEAGSAAANASMSSKGWTAIFYIKSLSTGGTKTFDTTATGWSNSGWAAFIAEISGQDTASFHDANNGATGNSGTLSASVTTTAANDMMVSVGASTGGDPAADTGYTGITLVNAFDFANAQYNLDVGAAGAKTVQMTAGSGQWAFKAAAFKAAGGITFPTLGIIDAFTRANENPLFGNWTNAGAGVDQLKLVSNQVVPSTAGTYNSSTWVNSFGPDFEFYVDVVTAPGTNGTYLAIECAVVREDFDATADGFQVQSRNISGTHTMRLYSIANGSYTQLGSDTSVGGTPQAIGISRSGTTVKAFVKVGGSWAEKISVTDSNYQVPLYPALITGAADDAVLDNFGGGTVGAGPAGWGRLFGADIHRLVQRVN